MQTVVLIPTYNEHENLAAIVPRVLAHPGVRVLVIDDASPDGTGELADAMHRQDARVEVLHRPRKQGLGLAYIAGMRRALAERFDLVCHMDADGSHDAADLPRLIDAAESCDLVIGSRYVPGGHLQNWPWHRVALSAFANRYVRAVTGMPIHDTTAGFRCWRSTMLARINVDTLLANGYAFQVETVYRALALGGRVCEVPITFTERTRGSSKMGGRIVLESAILPWRLRARIGPLPKSPREADTAASG